MTMGEADATLGVVDVIKSPKDPRLYRRITLHNGVCVLLISDPQMSDAANLPDEANQEMDEHNDDDDDLEDKSESGGDGDSDGKPEKKGGEGPTKRAAAAMAVGIGSFSDPAEAQGLSHFLEHMVFMGSAKYPTENEYDAYLTAHGGACNAFTEAEATCFHFDVQPNALHGALDRMAQFFIAPLMLEGAVEREVNAVDSEFVQVLQNDACRLMQVQCHTARDNHPFRIFSWGNRKSLVDMPKAAGVDTRPMLHEYFNKHYKPSEMSLVVLGGESLDKLQEWALEIFGAIPCSPSARVTFTEAGFPWAGCPPMLYTMPSVKEQHELHLTFALPCLFDKYKKKPDEYLSHLIGHEGKGSLLSALKEKGWATKLAAGVSDGGHERNTAAWLFQNTITLTQAGLENKLEVVGLFFQYIHMLRTEGPQQWVFDEVAAVKEIEFKFQEEEEADEYVVRLALRMHQFNPPDILCGEYFMKEWDPKLITKMLELMGPDSVRVDLLTSSFCEEASSLPSTETEPWFNVPFTREVLPDHLLQSWRSPAQVDPLLRLPPRNEYIPRNLSLRAHDIPSEAEQPGPDSDPDSLVSKAARPPVVVVDEDGLRVWHKQDDEFNTPRANVFIMVTSEAAYASARSAALTQMAMKLIKDALNETSYLADVAGLHASVWSDTHKLIIKLDGFSDKLPLLLERICTEVANHRVQDDRFEPLREELLRTYKNSHMKPTRHCAYLRQRALRLDLFPSHEQIEVLDKCTSKDVQDFLPSLMAKLHVEVLVHGNMTRADAGKVAALARATLLSGSERLPVGKRPLERCVQLGGTDACATQVALVERVKNPNEDNSVVESYFQLFAETVKGRAMVDLLEQIILEPCYDVLRTKEQLGYTVSCGMRHTLGVLGFCVLVQSSTHSVNHIKLRIDNFLATFVQSIDDMSDKDWEQHKEALVALKLQKDKCLYDETDHHWDAIYLSHYDFKMRYRVAEMVKTISKEELLEFFKTHIAPGGTRRRQMIAAVYGKQREMPSESGGAEAPAPVVVNSDVEITVWKQEQHYYKTSVVSPQ